MSPPSINAPSHYTNHPANADPSTRLPTLFGRGLRRTSLVYDSICKVLSERGEQVDWGEFSAAEWGLLPLMAKAEGVGPLLYWKLREDRGQRTEVRGQKTEISSISSSLSFALTPLIAHLTAEERHRRPQHPALP